MQNNLMASNRKLTELFKNLIEDYSTYAALMTLCTLIFLTNMHLFILEASS